MFLLTTFSTFSFVKSLLPFPWRYDFMSSKESPSAFSHLLADSNSPQFQFSHQQNGEHVRSNPFLRAWLRGLNAATYKVLPQSRFIQNCLPGIPNVQQTLGTSFLLLFLFQLQKGVPSILQPSHQDKMGFSV